MSKNKYQVWEGEMEVQLQDDREVTFLTVVFSSMLGIMLFVVLLCKTGFDAIFRPNRIDKRKSGSLPTVDCQII